MSLNRVLNFDDVRRTIECTERRNRPCFPCTHELLLISLLLEGKDADEEANRLDAWLRGILPKERDAKPVDETMGLVDGSARTVLLRRVDTTVMVAGRMAMSVGSIVREMKRVC